MLLQQKVCLNIRDAANASRIVCWLRDGRIRLAGKVAVITGSAAGLGRLGSPTGMAGCAPNLTAYSTSKAAIFGLTRAMAAAHAQDGIRVNLLVRGTMDTPMNAAVLSVKATREEYRQAVPIGRLGKPCDVEGIAVFLATDEASLCTGGVYTCDGGLTAV